MRLVVYVNVSATIGIVIDATMNAKSAFDNSII